MCSPDLSFLIKKDKTILQVPGIQSHSGVLAHFKIGPTEEDKIIKISYDWRTKTIDVIGENEGLLPFDLQFGHWCEIDNFIKSQVGSKKKLQEWLKVNIPKDSKIKEVAPEILSAEGFQEYMAKPKKKFVLANLFKVFDKFPNIPWQQPNLLYYNR
jgi:hypothetical protein